MKKFVPVTLWSVLLAVGATQAYAKAPCEAEDEGCRPTVTVTFTPNGGQQRSVSLPDMTFDERGRSTVRGFQHAFDGSGAEVSIDNLLVDSDPGVIFAISASTGASPGVFSFAFSTPIAISGPVDASSSLGATLTDGSVFGRGGSAGVTVSPFNVGGKIVTANDFDASLAATNKGVDVGPALIGGTGACGAFVVGTSVCGPFAELNTFSGGPFELMGVNVVFAMSEYDSVAMSGGVLQVPVPEPETYALMLAGLAGLGVMARRRGSV